MMKTIQAIIHCSDRVVILVHAEGDVGQSPVWKTADYILMPMTSQKPHILACDVPTILRKCEHVVFVQYILRGKKKKLKLWKSQEDPDRNYDVIC